MSFSLSFTGVKMRVSPSAAPNDMKFSISGVRHCDDGHIEAEFSGTIIITEKSFAENTNWDVVVDAIPEEVEKQQQLRSSLLTFNPSNLLEEPPEPYVSPIPHQSSQLTVDIDRDGDEEKIIQSPETESTNFGVRFDPSNKQIIQEAELDVDLRLHKACASEEAELDELRGLLRSKPELASNPDEFGDFPAHIFANNDSFIYTSSDHDVQQFVFELYTACPRAFLIEGYDGQIPFVGNIVDWIDDCHQMYSKRKDSEEVFRAAEIKTLTKSPQVISSLCVRDDIQQLVNLPIHISLPVKVIYSFKMLSSILDTLSQLAFEDISTRGEFWVVASKRLDKIIESVASLPFVVRTILLIENKTERNALIDLSIVRNLMFRPESVCLWLVALLSGGERAKACATEYLCLISRFSLSGLSGRRMIWGEADTKRFHFMREQLYDEIGSLSGFLPCMLHLGHLLYEVAPRRAVRYVVESTIGRPLPVYMMFMEKFMLLILMTSYRIIVELVYAIPSEQILSQYPEIWGLALTIAVYFGLRDLVIMVSLASTEGNLAWKYASKVANIIGYVTTASVITVLSMLHVNGNVEGRNFVGIVSGLLWWKFLLHVRGMSENLSTLIYTIIQIAAALKYFLAIFLIVIFVFADVIDIVKKTSGECESVDGEMESSLETFCSLTPLQTYLAMYGIMIGGIDMGTLEGSSALVSLLFVAASFCGVIVLVNILIAIVTGEYEKARERSQVLFARARLEAAAQQVAREKIWNPPDDPNSGMGMKLWRHVAKAKYLITTILVEFFLIKSLLSCSSLHKDGILGDFLYIALVLCAILYNMFVVAAHVYIFARFISDHERFQWLRGSKFHLTLLKISLKPVSSFVSSEGESCPDDSDMIEEDHPLSHDDFLGKQADFENKIQETLKASETRILHAVESMMMIQIPSPKDNG